MSHQSHIVLLCFFILISFVQPRLDHHDHTYESNHHVSNTKPTRIEIPRYVFIKNRQLENQTSIPSQPNSNHKKKSNKNKVVESLLQFLAGALSGGGSGLVFALFVKLVMFVIHRRKKGTSWKIYSTMIKKPEDLSFLETETGLANLDIIGRGGCGEVYKAVLRNGKEIAVKKISQCPRDPQDLVREEESKFLSDKKKCQVKSEVETVCRIRHRNLLPLLAHLSRPGYHYLVYEYMRNGSLQDYLKLVTEGKRELNWLARYKIALGVATGLEYLHMNHNPCIIHRDLKPANILLDDELEARIADFGLARPVPDSLTHISTSNVAGTIGYIAPEYYQTFTFTDKCDIYSFGVVLGVLMTGRLPSDEFFLDTDEMILMDWIRNLMASEDPGRAIDRKMFGNGYEEQMLLVLKIACFCTVEDPKERPNSKDVRCMLSQIMN